MSDNNELDEIYEIIDEMQSRLVEMFDQFRELRIRLGQKPLSFPPSESVSPSTDARSRSSDKSTKVDVSKEYRPEPDTVVESTQPDVRVSRLLDPISHELTTGNSPAEVIAEYLQAAKDELISKEAQDTKVSRDMDIVLKFLRARGRRGIRPEERDNILRRIKRWIAHLSK